MHTKGPWKAKGNYQQDSVFEILDATGKSVALIVWKSKEEVEANARLIAAAPELLEELEHLIYLVNKLSEWEDHTQKSRGIVSKAKGLST